MAVAPPLARRCAPPASPSRVASARGPADGAGDAVTERLRLLLRRGGSACDSGDDDGGGGGGSDGDGSAGIDDSSGTAGLPSLPASGSTATVGTAVDSCVGGGVGGRGGAGLKILTAAWMAMSSGATRAPGFVTLAAGETFSAHASLVARLGRRARAGAAVAPSDADDVAAAAGDDDAHGETARFAARELIGTAGCAGARDATRAAPGGEAAEYPVTGPTKSSAGGAPKGPAGGADKEDARVRPPVVGRGRPPVNGRIRAPAGPRAAARVATRLPASAEATTGSSAGVSGAVMETTLPPSSRSPTRAMESTADT